ARRLAPEPSGMNRLVRQLEQSDERVRLDILQGIQEAFIGQRQVAMPNAWPAIYRKLVQSPDASVREKTMLLAVLFDYQDAVKTLRRVVADRSAAAALRLNALQALAYKKDAALIPLLQDLLTDRTIRAAALRSLAVYNDAESPRLILNNYLSFTDE